MMMIGIATLSIKAGQKILGLPVREHKELAADDIDRVNTVLSTHQALFKQLNADIETLVGDFKKFDNKISTPPVLHAYKQE